MISIRSTEGLNLLTSYPLKCPGPPHGNSDKLEVGVVGVVVVVVEVLIEIVVVVVAEVVKVEINFVGNNNESNKRRVIFIDRICQIVTVQKVTSTRNKQPKSSRIFIMEL